MRKIIGLLAIFPLLLGAQTNTFPTSGNVGIGTTSPVYLLDVNGVLHASNFLLGATGAAPVITATGSGHLYINSGNVNIGDYNGWVGSGANLTVLNSASLSGSVWVGLSLNYYSRFYTSPQTGNSFYDWYILGNTYHLFQLGLGTVKMPVLATGTGNGVQLVTVGEDGSVSKLPQSSISGSGWSLTGNTGTSQSNFIGTASGNTQPLIFKTNGTEAFRINSSGQISIGTTDPTTYKFAVNGDAIFTKIKVKLNASWPDYVFNDGYKLPSLNEVEKYLHENKHLSEVPSAKNINDDGLDLGDNQSVLLKKIEELTLYIIDINKRLERLSKENNELERKLETIRK